MSAEAGAQSDTCLLLTSPHFVNSTPALNAHSNSAPSALATRLGYAGLIPFVGSCALIWLVHAELLPVMQLALTGYATCIVSFLGGVHWGLAMKSPATHERTPYLWACVPPSVASVAMLMPAHAGLVILGVMLIVCYVADRKYYMAHGLHAWLTLRFRLTAIAAFTCFLGASGS